jgi:hypothetical protein
MVMLTAASFFHLTRRLFIKTSNIFYSPLEVAKLGGQLPNSKYQHLFLDVSTGKRSRRLGLANDGFESGTFMEFQTKD